jgi:hypothetical protein
MQHVSLGTAYVGGNGFHLPSRRGSLRPSGRLPPPPPPTGVVPPPLCPPEGQPRHHPRPMVWIRVLGIMFRLDLLLVSFENHASSAGYGVLANREGHSLGLYVLIPVSVSSRQQIGRSSMS